MSPSLSQVIMFVHQFSRSPLTSIHEDTFLEADLGITGDDGVELLREAEKKFRIDISSDEGFHKAFALKENEYLFESEGFDPFCILHFFNWLRGIPKSVIRDLTVGQLHKALNEARDSATDNF